MHALLVADGWNVNVKRIRRLWVLEQLKVPARKAKCSGKKAQGTDANSAWALPAIRPNHIWSYDFVAARTNDGAPLRILNVVDEYTRQNRGSHIARSIGATAITRFLEKLFARHGQAGDHPQRQRPRVHLRDRHELAQTTRRDPGLHRQGKPAAELLRRTLQRHHARRTAQRRAVPHRARSPRRDHELGWVTHYNTDRPHQALDMATPAQVFTRGHPATHPATEPASEQQAATRPAELGALRSDRRGASWVSRHVSANGVICVSWQQICVGVSHAGANVDVEVGDQLLQIWRGEELIKTVPRTSRGEVRKKKASVQQHRPTLD